MATRTQSRSSNRSTSGRGGSSRASNNRSAFSWGEGAGPVIAAAIGGIAIGMAAN